MMGLSNGGREPPGEVVAQTSMAWRICHTGANLMQDRQYSNRGDGAIQELPQSEVLGAARERELLTALAECKRKLSNALAEIKPPCVSPGGDDPHIQAQSIASYYSDGPAESGLGVVFRRYC